MDSKVKNVVVALHGVMTKRKGNWLSTYRKHFEKDTSFDDSWIFISEYWGWLFFGFSIIPFIRHAKVKRIQRRLREIQNKYPNATIHIVAHSYGTLLSFQAVKYSDIDQEKPPVKIGKLILIGGILPRELKFSTTLQENQIQTIYNFCSYQDKVIKYQPIFDKCGYWGFTKPDSLEHKFQPFPDLEVYNYRFNLGHSDYFTEETPNFYILWNQLLRR